MSIFTQIKKDKQNRSTFNLSYDRKMSLNMGTLTPVHIQEVIPGDRIEMSTQQMLRMMPMVAPVMHEVNVTMHYFYVPNRILWNNWEDFITGGDSGLDSPLLPTVNMFDLAQSEHLREGTLADYLGLPTSPRTPNFSDDVDVSILPFLAYAHIYNEYYRDQNLQEDIIENLAISDGLNNIGDIEEILLLRRRAWNHDYFTSALPFAQKGNPVRMPVDGQAPIVFNSDDLENNPQVVYNDDGVPQPASNLSTTNDGHLQNDGNGISFLDNSKQLLADLGAGISTTITDLRNAFSLQRWLERNARAGSRYNESILANFGVDVGDARINRPEYLGGGKSPMLISEVLQTSETEGSPQGNMAGHGLNLGGNRMFNYFCREHGYIIGIMSIMPKTTYQQGVPRHWSKFDKFDYYWKDFENIGEQEILNKEIYLGLEDNQDTFGYIPRYSEYKYQPSTVHGYFRSSLNFWHMGRIFENRPALNAEFVQSDPTRRIYAVDDPNEQTILAHVFHDIKASRPMSYYSDPGLFRL